MYLPVELKSALRRVALRRGISEAQLIRESIQHEVSADRPAPRAGLYASGDPIARDTDRHLRGFGDR